MKFDAFIIFHISIPLTRGAVKIAEHCASYIFSGMTSHRLVSDRSQTVHIPCDRVDSLCAVWYSSGQWISGLNIVKYAPIQNLVPPRASFKNVKIRTYQNLWNGWNFSDEVWSTHLVSTCSNVYPLYVNDNLVVTEWPSLVIQGVKECGLLICARFSSCIPYLDKWSFAHHLAQYISPNIRIVPVPENWKSILHKSIRRLLWRHCSNCQF